MTKSAPKWVCAAAIAAGLAAFAVQCSVDVYQGTRGITDTVEWWAQFWTWTLPTAFTITFSAFGGALLRVRAWVAAALLYVVVGVVMVITASNSIDFLTDKTVAKTVAANHRVTAAKDIAEIQSENAKTERKDTLDNLWRTYVVAKKAEDKEKVLAQIKSVTDKPLPVQTPAVEELKAGGGTILNRYTGLPVETIQEVRAVAVPIVFLIAKSLAITLGFAFWPRPELYGDRKPGNSGNFGTNVAGLRKTVNQNAGPLGRDDALSDLLAYFPLRQEELTISFLKERWRVSKQSTYIWLKEWETQGLIALKYSGNRLYVSAIKPKMSIVKQTA